MQFMLGIMTDELFTRLQNRLRIFVNWNSNDEFFLEKFYVKLKVDSET